jgi:hypothetical protein
MKITIWHRQGLFDQAPGSYYVRPDTIEQLFRGYVPGDRIKRVYEYTHDTGLADLTPDRVIDIVEQAFRMFNGQPDGPWEHSHTQRYYDASNRSLSVGDVVAIGEVALSCEQHGWVFVTLPPQTER